MTDLNQSIANLRMPLRMNRLPVSPKGYPVPYFVGYVNGVPDFRVIGPNKVFDAIRQKRCWLCGDLLGSYKCFVVGPMCTINRVSAEPPSHLECAQYAAVACPFLTKPNMRRNDKDMPVNSGAPGGVMVERNPGVTVLWVTKVFKLFNDGQGGVLFKLGDPINVFWYAEGRKASRAEVDESIHTGLPVLEGMAAKEGYEAQIALQQHVKVAQQFFPQEE